MTDPDGQLAERRAVERPQWKGHVPDKLFTRLSAAPVAGDALCALGDALLATVSRRILELVALRTSAVRDCPYMWNGHCRIALEPPDPPLTAECVARVAAGPAALAGHDAVVVQGIDDVLAGRGLGAWAEDAIGDGALSVLIATLFYATVATIMSDAEPDAQPVPGLETPAIAARRVRW
jgi:alkylhydroperoxidase family enzyme